LQAPAGSSAERRQLTVVFCDIVDSTRLAARADGEEWLRLLTSYRRKVISVIARWGGKVDFYAGDGVCAYFGYPYAHEDDAERAVRAALDIVTAIASIDPDDPVATQRALSILLVRVGVHTGSVILADLGTTEQGEREPNGPTMNVAARLQAYAPPGAVVMSDATERLVEGRFLTEDLGTPALKGVEETIRAYLVRPQVSDRGNSRTPRKGTRIVGRDRELAALQAYWDKARSGHSQAVVISGEAGIGKSRLVARFTENVLEQDDARIVEWRCSPFYTTSPLHPLIERLENQLGFERGSTPRGDITARLQPLLAASGVTADPSVKPQEVAAAIHELVSGEPARDSPAAETPAVRRSRALQLLCDVAVALGRNRPTVLLVEDLHWADASTLELIGLLVNRASDVALVLLLTCRSDFVLPWAEPVVHRVSLDALPPAAGAVLIDAIVGDRPLPVSVRQELLARSDGIPLFIEELTRTVLDCADDCAPDVLSSIPNTLRGLLQSRLDRLSPGALDTIHLASALNRQFRFDLLGAVSTKSTEALRVDLDELAQLDLVFRAPALPGDAYTFKHALVADAAYDSILPSDRRRLHGQIAHRLVDAFPSMSTEQPEILAHHLGEAGEIETAVEHWRRAGDNAIANGAYQEAVSHFDRGLKLAEPVGGRDGLQLEIELTESKGTALFSMLGYSHPLVESTFARALTLCEQLGSPPSLRVLHGVWAHHVTRSNRDAVEALLPRFKELATNGDPVALLAAHANAGMRAFYYARFEECVEEMTTASRWYATTEHSTFLRRHGYGGGLYPFAVRMWAQSILGRRDEAFAAETELEHLAEQAANPYGLAIANGFRVNLSRDRRDPDHTVQMADRQIEYARRQMLPMWEGAAHCSRGWAMTRRGETAAGLAEIRLGLQYLDAVGLRATYPYHLAGLVESLILAGELETALAEVRRGLSMCETGLDRFYEAELLRLEGECQRRLDQPAAAESGFRRAIELARGQSARFFAIRAANSLASLLVEQGRGDLARRELVDVLAESGSELNQSDVPALRGLGATA
jgi:class 3 adenylate cyclase/tetratricopeptide (TPR) repeat protein